MLKDVLYTAIDEKSFFHTKINLRVKWREQHGVRKTTMSMATGPSADDVIGSLLRLFTFLHSATESGMSVEPREQPAQCSCKHMFTLNLCNCLPQLKVHSWGQFVEKAMTSCNGCHRGVCAHECVCAEIETGNDSRVFPPLWATQMPITHVIISHLSLQMPLAW